MGRNKTRMKRHHRATKRRVKAKIRAAKLAAAGK